ncbi:MAG: deoxyribodipyrimidine photo-lyase [Bacteroidetes bacterium]|nr:deoxyribodipyrimidine photo-lyase [Bacteroidota bacterium]
MNLPSFTEPFVVHWFRRDLRWHDNRSLHAALTSGLPVVPLFVFDANILKSLDDRDDARVTFLHQTVSLMAREAQSRGSGLLVAHGTPSEVMKRLLETGQFRAVYANEDYEPYADERDGEVSLLLGGNDVAFHTFTDHVVQAPGEVVKPDGNPYTVFTPFSKRWHANLKEEHLRAAPSEEHLDQLLQWSAPNLPTFKDLGFEPSDIAFPDAQVDLQVVRNYAETRDIPSVRGTSRISVHLRFGTLSIREAAKLGFKHSDKWLTELIWRDFYQAIMRAFPHSMIQAFKPQYDRVPWRHDDAHFEAWKNGKTGYPLVDAGMRELRATGFMHNRVRMVVASFLCKHLLLDWRLGERHFAKHLLDFELASNVGGWQWAAGSGCDAAPYFRVFNPTSQLEKFDPDCAYVKTWVPEWGTSHYPAPIVEHKMARQRAIDTYKAALT